MFSTKFRKLIGIVIILTLLISQAPPVNALYSPALNTEFSIVKQHLQKSKIKTGSGTLQQAYDKAKENANQGFVNLFTTSIKEVITQSLRDSFLDGLSLLFGRWIGTGVWISNCLRDDIWELQALQEQVLDEVFRSSVLSNLEDANILWQDYNDLKDLYYYLKSDFKNGKFWFPKTKNYYIDCPYGEFTKAWKDIKRALDSFKTIGKGSIELGDFGAMAVIAQIRAIKRAEEWIKKNQISLTIGGLGGSNPRDISTTLGLKGLAADIKTQLDYAKSIGKLVFTNTYNAFSTLTLDQNALNTIDKYLAAQQKASEAAQTAQDQMKSAIKFNLSLNSVAETSLIEIDKVLAETNYAIQSTFDTKLIEKNLTIVCNEVMAVLNKQCKDKGAATGLSCNK